VISERLAILNELKGDSEILDFDSVRQVGNPKNI
jgi:hypothetical protein